MRYIKMLVLLSIILLKYYPDISAQYIINNSVFGNGFPADSGNYIVSGTLGQTITGTLSDEESISFTGFWSYFIPEKIPAPVYVNENNTPKVFRIIGSYPNPFNPSTTLSFELPKQQRVRIAVYSLNGQVIETLLNETLQDGVHSFTWRPEGLASGSYIYLIEAGTSRISGKVLLLK